MKPYLLSLLLIGSVAWGAEGREREQTKELAAAPAPAA